MRKTLQALFIAGLMLNITTLFAQEKISNENKVYQVKELLDDKHIDVKIKEYLVHQIRKTDLVKPIDNHDFVHFFTARYDKKIKPLIFDRFNGKKTFTQSELTSIVNDEFIPALAKAFNQYRIKHPKEAGNPKNSNIKNVSHFELYDLVNRETNKGPGQPCNNADFETGDATGWDLSYGGVDPAATAPFSYINVTATTLGGSPGQHTIMTGAGTDAIGGFPVVFPGGAASLMIGDGTGVNNSAADASQTFMVDAGSAAFSYSYAIVLMDPGHTVEQQPYFKVNMYDASGNSIQCGDYSVVAGGTALDPDFVPFTFNGENGVYMPWRTTFAPLQAYIGTDVTIEFVVGDCNQSGHFGYAYLDASCAPMDVLGPDTITCAGFPTISAPPGAASYLWTPTGETTQSIVATAPGNYTVAVTPVTGAACAITLDKDIYEFIDTVTSVFNAVPTNICTGESITFTDQSVLVGIGAIDGWEWDFDGDGTVDNTTQNPSYVYNTPGTYNVNLNASSGVCEDDTIRQVVVIAGTTADFTAPTVCVGMTTDFTDASLGAVDTWAWDFNNDGIVDNTTQNPSYTFPAAGTYPVNLEVSIGGSCADDTTINVIVSQSSTANFTAPTVCVGVATAFTDVSIGGVDTWGWDFDNDGIVDNTTQNPSYTFPAAGTYPVNLEVSVGGFCLHDTTINITISTSSTAIFTSTTVCNGVATDFTDASIGGVDTWGWDFNNDGIVDNATQNPSYTFPTSGTFPVNLEVSVGGVCSHDTTINVIVSTSSTAIFTSTTVCVGVATDFTDVSIGGVDAWGWDFDNDGIVDNTTQNPSYTFPTSGTFPVNLEVSVGGVCSHDTTINVTVSTSSIAIFTSTTVCNGVATDFTDASIGGVDTWGWDFNNDGIVDNTTQNPSYTFPTSGTFPVNLEVSVGGVCSHDTTINVTVNQGSTAIFTSTTGCLGVVTDFTDTSIGGVDTWGWDFDNDGIVDNATQNPSYTFPTSGTFPVNLEASVGGLCVHDTTIDVIVSPQPTAGYTFTNVCFGTTTGFTDLSSGNGGTINQWAWDFTNNGSVDNATQNPSNGYASAGSYTVELHVTTTDGCKDSITRVVVVNPIPVADFTATTECLGNTTTFTDASTVTTGSITNWAWDFGDTGTDATQNPTHTYLTSGNFNTVLTVTSDSGCINNYNTNVTVYSNPIASFTADEACLTLATTFTESSTPGDNPINTWNWDFDNNGSVDVSEQSPTFIFPTSGIHNVNLYVEDNQGCNHDTVLTITVSENPIANFTHSNECYGTATIFTDLSNNNGGTTNIDTWQWDFDGNGSIDDATPNPTNTFPLAGTYQTELFVTSTLGCKDSMTIAVVVNPIPVANFTATSECFEYTTTFTNTSTITTGTIAQNDWDFDDAIGTSALLNPTYIYGSSGTFNVELIVTSDSGCTHSVIVPVIVYPKPTADFDTTDVCLNIAAQFTDQSLGNGGTINGWTWDFENDGVVDNSTTQSPSHYYPAAGTYTIELIASTTDGCKDTINKTVTIHPMPVADFTYINDCVDAGINFNNTSTVSSGTVDTWAWQFGDAQTSAVEDPLHNYASQGVYNVQLIVTTNNNCKDSIVKNGIEVWPLPDVNFGPTSVCLNDSTQFTDSSSVSNLYTVNNNVAWSWDFADGIGTSNAQDPIYMYTTDGIFMATLTVTTDHNCVNDTTIPVTVHPLPVVEFLADTLEHCTPVQGTLIDLTTINGTGNTIIQWDWDFNSDGISDASGQNPGYSFPNPSHSSVRDFDIRLIATSNFGCKDTLIKTDYIHSYPIPLASFMYWPNDEASIVDNDITFTDQSIIGSIFNWDLGDGTLTNVQHPVHEYADTGFYLVTLAIENVYGCPDITQKYVYIKPIYAIYIPNSFTPNGDNTNDYFYVNGYGIKELQMMIFNRWGEKLYDDIGVDQSWDGVYKGNLVPTDVYVYKVRAKDVFDEWHDYIGKVTVIK